MRWLKKIVLCRIFRQHNWWNQVVYGSGFNLKTGEAISHHDEYVVCVRCGDRP